VLRATEQTSGNDGDFYGFFTWAVPRPNSVACSECRVEGALKIREI